MAVFGITDKYLIIYKIDGPPRKVMNLPSPKPAVESQQAFIMESQRNIFDLRKQRIGFVFGEETKSSVVNLGPAYSSCRIFACHELLSESRIPEERDDRHGILRCPWSKSRLHNRTNYGINVAFFSTLSGRFPIWGRIQFRKSFSSFFVDFLCAVPQGSNSDPRTRQ